MPKGELPEFDGTDSWFFANMTKAIFTMGFSRKVVDDKWEGFEEVFDQFDIDSVASWQEGDIVDALEDARIVRNAKKIEATVENAKYLQQVIAEHGSIQAYLDSIDEENFDKKLKIISKPVHRMGPKAAHLFLWLSHQPVPEH